MPLHKQKVHNAQNVLETKIVDGIQLVGNFADKGSEEEIEMYKNFLLASEMEIGDVKSSIMP